MVEILWGYCGDILLRPVLEESMICEFGNKLVTLPRKRK